MKPEEIKEIMSKLAVNRAGLAALTGASKRTVDGWLFKRPPSGIAQKLLSILAAKK